MPEANFHQIVPCECGAENACLCGRCHGCGKQRFPAHESICNKAQDFERNNGSITFLKTCMSAINKLLVKKGLVSEDELRQAVADEITSVTEKKT